MQLQRPECEKWDVTVAVDIKLVGKVVHGFQRGSKQLGVPTANLEMTATNESLLMTAVPGVYMAHCELTQKSYKAAVSVGWNPVYDNAQKTLEAYLISDENLDDFYGQSMQVHLKRYIRPEAWYDSFDALLIAISADIQQTTQ